MAFDQQEMIRRLESSTFRAALKGLLINLVAVIAALTGKTLDAEWVHAAVDYGLPMLLSAANVWLFWRSMRGRVVAEKKIDTSVPLKAELTRAAKARLPWLDKT